MSDPLLIQIIARVERAAELVERLQANQTRFEKETTDYLAGLAAAVGIIQKGILLLLRQNQKNIPDAPRPSIVLHTDRASFTSQPTPENSGP